MNYLFWGSLILVTLPLRRHVLLGPFAPRRAAGAEKNAVGALGALGTGAGAQRALGEQVWWDG